MSKWTKADEENARAEGWVIGRNSNKLLALGSFLAGFLSYKEADDKAYQFVKARADEGSELHKKAIAVIVEYKLRK